MYNIYFVPGPGVDDGYANSKLPVVLGTTVERELWRGASQEQALTYLRQRHAEEGWADELEFEHYARHHSWGLHALEYFAATGAPVSMPVRHGAYVLACDVS